MSDVLSETAAEPLAELAPAQADAEALAEVYRQGVDAAAASPGVQEYLRDTLVYSLLSFFEWLEGKSAWFAWLDSDLLADALTVVLVVLAGVIIWLLVRRLLRRRTSAVADGSVTAAPARAAETPDHDWGEELRRRLQRGDVPAALEALWWWLASAVGAREADPSWTSRELLLHAGRSDLRRPVRRLDHFLYGPATPGPDQVGELWRSLRPLVAKGEETVGETPDPTAPPGRQPSARPPGDGASS